MDIQNELKKEGYRLTRPRQEVINTVSNYPLTAQEIHNKLKKKKKSMNLTSVYRSLELFTTLGHIRALDLGDGKRRYEHVDEDNHHHHFTCEKCQTIIDFSSSFGETMLKDVQKRNKFTIKSHSIELSGICSKCN